MAKQRNYLEHGPPCYAMVFPGLETIAAQEIEQELAGKVKRTGPGLVVFRVPVITASLCQLRTTEDVFLLAWGTDQLTYRAQDLQQMEQWTNRAANWSRLLAIHHSIRPKPKGKPTFRLVVQMSGTHGYRRLDARKALARGLAGRLPASWRHVDEHAAVEIWLTITGGTAVCGLRLSDRTMRHRAYKLEHIRASLRPTVAAALVRLAGTSPQHGIFLDPMCGAGTILAEYLAVRDRRGSPDPWGGDMDRRALAAARINVRHLGQAHLLRWDARRLPLPNSAVGCLVSNPPFGKQLSEAGPVKLFYRELARDFHRVVRPGGRIVLLVSDFASLRGAAGSVGWKLDRQLTVRVLGQKAVASVWQRPN
jgi:23S rRNA G2445 N2-methylase RlmL